jgi:hypothetical protein
MFETYHRLEQTMLQEVVGFAGNKRCSGQVSTLHLSHYIPKVNNPETMKEFRPISLVSMPLKFITKLLANRLQKEIIPMLHQNQYGFIKGKTIHDCLGWVIRLKRIYNF